MAFEDDSEWLDARITRTEELIVIHEDAIAALAGGAQSYHLDTGQTSQTVTKAQLSQLKNTLDQLENRRSSLRARRYGAGITVKPGF